jgi:hypothetical protein
VLCSSTCCLFLFLCCRADGHETVRWVEQRVSRVLQVQFCCCRQPTGAFVPLSSLFSYFTHTHSLPSPHFPPLPIVLLFNCSSCCFLFLFFLLFYSSYCSFCSFCYCPSSSSSSTSYCSFHQNVMLEGIGDANQIGRSAEW